MHLILPPSARSGYRITQMVLLADSETSADPPELFREQQNIESAQEPGPCGLRSRRQKSLRVAAHESKPNRSDRKALCEVPSRLPAEQ